MIPEATAVNPDASLVRIARAALDADVLPSDVPWETIDLSDPAQCRFGDYTLVEQIGKGGMGVVYRAHQASLDREVAIKFIAAGLADDPAFVARFLAEAQAAARLNHPNIVPVYEVGTVDCLHYFSMPLLRGQTLADVLEGASLSVAESVALLRKLCSAVAYAHSLGLLHLDLKPANVMIDAHGEPMIGDFGLARRMDDRGGVDAQEVSGTPAYMAPEQIQIRQFRLTTRTDLYALGAILYRLLSGAPPHGRGTPQQLMQNAISGRITPLREIAPAVPADLAAIVMACLTLHAEDRYASVADLAADLARFADGNPVSVRRPGRIERLVRVARRNPGATWATVVAVVALVGGLALSTWQWRVAEAARVEASTRATRMQQLADMLALSVSNAPNHDQEDFGVQADALVDWLDAEEPDPRHQAELLGVFVKALRAAGKDRVVEQLLWGVPGRFGLRYREKLAAEMAARGDADGLTAALLLSVKRAERFADDPVSLGYVDTVLERFPDDRLAMTAAVVYCNNRDDGCGDRRVAEALKVLDSDNMLAHMRSIQGDRLTDDELRAMARGTRVDDGLSGFLNVLQRTVGDRPPPDSVKWPLTAFMSPDEADVFARREATASLPLPAYEKIGRTCNPVHAAFTESSRAPCVTIARALFAQKRNSIVTAQIGGVMVRRLLRGTPEAEEAKRYRRQYVWLREKDAIIDNMDERILQFDADTAAFGEWEAIQRMATRLGIPLEPPSDWVPEQPGDLLLPEERTPEP